MNHSDPLGVYRALGLTPTATTEEIAAAFRKRSKETHPDSSGRDSTDEFREVSGAYEVLGDPIRRREYDRAARDLYEEQQRAWEAMRPSVLWHARSFLLRTTGLLMRLTPEAVLLILAGCAFVVWMVVGVNNMRNAELALAQKREADIVRRFPTCASPPFAGTLGPEGEHAGSHYVRIENNTFYNMIVKVRDVKSGHVVASFYIPRDRSFFYDHLSAGEYKIQYAFGSKLDVECRNLLEPIVISEYSIVLSNNNSENSWSYNFNSLPYDSPARYGPHGSSAYYYVRVPLVDFLKP